MSNIFDFSFNVQDAGITATEVGQATSAAPAKKQDGLFGNNFIFIMLPLLLVLMLLSGGGNRKKQKQMQAMLKSLEKGDKVQSIGGIIGTVSHVKDESIVVQVDDNTKIEFTIGAIQTVLKKKNPAAQVEQKPRSLKEWFASKKAQKNDSNNIENK